ncbi:hypothetical protein CVT26_004172 [Gymnopilus dilepis]|uniref:F-box domain-containing protein n=1 Tax=Gymnopilus dilepis TaxID=231916 RepID=A0A409YML0_9AGAR|nr:hypothetical protein CVT26_004172 [Gymnopilus dilepis]
MHTLNDDVLHEIVEDCCISSLTNLCRVSTRFYAIALPHLLRHIVFTDGPDQMLQFFRFIIDNATCEESDETSREIAGRYHLRRSHTPGIHVVSFRVEEDAFGTYLAYTAHSLPKEYELEAWAPIMTKALALMPNLRSLAITASFNSICKYSPEISTIILSKPFLVDLQLGSIHDYASLSLGEAVSSSKANIKLKQITIETVSAHTEGLRDLLFSCRNSLKMLSCSDSNIQNLLFGSRGTDPKTPLTFPNVHALYLDTHFLMSDVALSFPSLRTLDVSQMSFSKYHFGGPDHGEALQYLVSISVAGLKDLSILLQNSNAFPCLRRLALYGYWGESIGDLTTASAIAQGIQGLRSLRLHLYVDDISGSELDVLRFFIKSLPRLSYLYFGIKSPSKDQSELLDTETSHELFQSNSLEYISVVFQRPSSTTTAALDAMVLSYAQTIKSLKYMDIRKTSIDSLSGRYQYWNYWWKIIRQEGLSGAMGGIKLEGLNVALAGVLRNRYDQAAF